MEKNQIQSTLDSIKDLPTLPAIAVEINKLLENPDTSIEKVKALIEKDQAIATKILKLINSAFYGVRSQVTSVHEAIILLGFNSIRNIVLSVSVMKTFSGVGSEDGFSIDDFWKHSIAVAMTAKYLAGKSKLFNQEDCFTAGLLHDMGKIVIVQYFTDTFFNIIKDVEQEYLPFTVAEKKYLQNMGHAQIGAFLAAKWKLPSHLCTAIMNHHLIKSAETELGIVVHVADIIVNIHKVNMSSLSIDQKRSKMPIVHNTAAKKLKEYFATSGQWYPELDEKISEACSFFIE